MTLALIALGLAAGIVVGVLVGFRWRRSQIHHLVDVIVYLRRCLAAAKRDPAHHRCRQVEQRLHDHIDLLDGGAAAQGVTELEAFLADQTGEGP